jgi:two-component system phosphate regulon sensor histidine kinase PhoR
LQNRLLFLFLLFFVLIFVPVGWYASRILYASYLSQFRTELESMARLVETQVTGPEGFIEVDSLDRLCGDLGRVSNVKILLLLPDGRAVGNSEAGSAGMANQSDLEEVQEAQGGEVGHSIRYSLLYQQTMVFVAIPFFRRGEIAGIVRVSQPLALVERAIGEDFRRIFRVGLLSLAAAGLICFWFLRKTLRPLDRLRKGLDRYASGNLTEGLYVHGSEEIQEMASSAKRLAGQLAETYQKITSRRNRLDAVLAALEEGVIFIDSGERVNTLNQAASLLLGVDHTESVGRTLQEVIRNADMQKFCEQALKSKLPLDEEIVDGDRTWIVHSTRLFDPERKDFGTLVVIRDVTRLLKLETIRKDFVANVSHELRTPVTSIKGFLETLQDGAIDRPEEAKRFLDILARHTNRLEAIIEDLLTLSGLDREKTRPTTPRIDTDVGGMVRSVVRDMESYAASRQIRLNLSVEDEVRLSVDPALVSHAVQNLLDNAIKYSEPEGEVRVRVRDFPGEVRIDVADNGCGIESAHLERIFERFYRVDPARSRKLGGTGLGLSIVKNVMQIHGGRVSVESVPGEGSTFTLHFPKN